MDETIWMIVGFAAVITVAATALVFFIMKQVNHGGVYVSRSEAEAMREGNVACPRCHQQMESGWAVLPYGAHWYRRDAKVSSVNTIWAALPNTANSKIKIRYNTAWRCEACKLVTVDHSKMVV